MAITGTTVGGPVFSLRESRGTGRKLSPILRESGDPGFVFEPLKGRKDGFIALFVDTMEG